MYIYKYLYINILYTYKNIIYPIYEREAQRRLISLHFNNLNKSYQLLPYSLMSI